MAEETTTGNKKTMFIAIGAVALVAVLAIAFLVMKKRGGEPSIDTSGSPAAQATGPMAGSPGMSGRGGGPMGMGPGMARGGAPMGPGMGRGGPGGMTMGPSAAPAASPTPAAGTVTVAAGGAEAGAAAAQIKLPGATYPGPKEANRIDPFVHQPLPPEEIRRRAELEKKRKLWQKQQIANYIPSLPVALVQDGGIHFGGTGTELTTLRRTAGLLWNGQVYGLIQLGDDYYVVRPGDRVGDYKVTAITRDSIVLYSSELRKQIQIPLQGPRAEMQQEAGVTPEVETPAYNYQPRLGIVDPGSAAATPGSGDYDPDEVAPGIPDFPTYGE